MASQTTTLAEKIVAQADVKAERLISLLRMALATSLFVGVSYVMSQTGAAGLEGRQVELNFLRLGAVAYFCLGAANFYFADAKRFRPWMSWVFNCAEVMLVSFQLYVDVSDPNSSSLLAFASPVLLIVALVISVQALRSQLLLHIATSALLLASCALILFHNPQVGVPAPDAALSELQAVYTLPPTVMRLLMLTAMAGVIGTAVYKSMQLVKRVGRETETAENRKRFLPNEISDTMSDLDIEALRLGRETDLAVLFVDIRDFTALAEGASPKETAALLSEFRGFVSDAAVENEGIVDKFIGDGALLIFGLNSDVSQAAQNAISAAQSLLEAIKHWNTARVAGDKSAIGLAIGIHAGPAIIGAVGDARRLEFTAIGETVNLASRLEETAKKHNKSLIVSRSTFDLLNTARDDFLPLGLVDIRGSAHAIEVFALN